MTNDKLQSIWKEQRMQTGHYSPEVLEDRARCFEQSIRRRNAFEYAAAALVALFFAANGLGLLGGAETGLPAVARQLGSVLMILGAGVVCWQLGTRAAAPQPNPGTMDSLSYLRTSLTRQRDALRAVWLWYIGPLLPGFAVLFAGAWLTPAADKGVLLIIQSIVVLVLVGVLALNRAAARRLQREIDRLDSERDQT